MVAFERADYAGPTPTMRATYTGTPDGQRISQGQVTWKDQGLTIVGTWKAKW
ncbi:MAG TPA: hypothetical protein VHM24_10575 [Gemmatimonadaceae bacterium]|nr:hypothetical protein [Gemmatimonadaceae bacterium]